MILDSLYDFLTNDDAAPSTYLVRRLTPPVPAYDAHGRALPSVQTSFPIQANLQPLSGRELMVLPEGQRSEETKWLYSDQEIRALGKTNAPDEVDVTYPSGLVETYVVTSVEYWPYPPESQEFWKARVSRRAVP